MEENLSSVEIGKILNRGYRTVQRALNKNGVQLRSLSDSQFVKLDKTPNIRLYDKDWLYEQHITLKRSCKDIAEELEVDARTVRRHMQKLDIHTRTNAESKIGLMVGDKHPNWKGGVTDLYPLLRLYFKTNIAPNVAKRDEYTCQLCGATHTVLHVHHIISFSQIVKTIIDEHPEIDSESPNGKAMLYDIIVHDKRFLDEDNLITYCKDCHFFKIHKYQHKKTISNQAPNGEGSETIQ